MPTLSLGFPPATPTPKAPRAPLTPDPTPLFDQLLPCSWRGIVFPVTSLKVSFTQDHAEHKYYGIDGASVEATGRGSMLIEATIPFVNGIAPGKNERWDVLYPKTFRDFWYACEDPTTGQFQHAEFDIINCKLVSIDVDHDPHRRDGVEVKARWIETITPDETVNNSSPSPIQAGAVAAVNLDASGADLDLAALFKKAGLAPLPTFDTSFFDALDNVRGTINSTASAINKLTHTPAQMLSRVKKVQDSVDNLHSALTWQTTAACEQMKAAMLDLQLAPAAKGGAKTIKRYTTSGPTTLAAIASTVNRSVDDVIKLNPGLLSSPKIGPGVIVLYYG